jgi:hypothetical protein
MAVITSLSGEMLRGSNSEAIVRQVLLDNVGPALDAAMFSDTAAVTEERPAGLLNGIADSRRQQRSPASRPRA